MRTQGKWLQMLCGGCCLALLLLGCAPATERIDTGNDHGPEVMGLDYRDFDLAATEAIQKMIQSGSVSHPGGGRYVMMVSRVINDTMQRIDTAQLTKKIRVELLNSGKVVTTTAIGVDGPEDEATQAVRDLRNTDEVNQRNVPGKGRIQSPDLSLSGKLIQRNLVVSSRKQRVEYYLQLTLTDVKSGLALWENETLIVKQGRSGTTTW